MQEHKFCMCVLQRCIQIYFEYTSFEITVNFNYAKSSADVCSRASAKMRSLHWPSLIFGPVNISLDSS